MKEQCKDCTKILSKKKRKKNYRIIACNNLGCLQYMVEIRRNK